MLLTIRTTRKKEVVDITQMVSDHILRNKWGDGVVHLFVAHTTCSLTTTDLDPGTDTDILYALDHILPKASYRHPHDPSHVGDHILSSVIGPSVFIPIHEGKLFLGMWQKVVLIELEGPRERSIMLRLLRTVDS